jgi:DNA-binding transcriptional MerR regulator
MASDAHVVFSDDDERVLAQIRGWNAFRFLVSQIDELIAASSPVTTSEPTFLCNVLSFVATCAAERDMHHRLNESADAVAEIQREAEKMHALTREVLFLVVESLRSIGAKSVHDALYEWVRRCYLCACSSIECVLGRATFTQRILQLLVDVWCSHISTNRSGLVYALFAELRAMRASLVRAHARIDALTE